MGSSAPRDAQLRALSFLHRFGSVASSARTPHLDAMRFLTSISNQLSRRSAWQILGSYAVGAWLVLQLAETLSSLLGLPLWFGSAVVSLLVAGAPVLLLTTFIQRRRPSNLDTTEGGPTGAKGVFTWRNSVLGGVAAAALLVASVVAYLTMWGSVN